MNLSSYLTLNAVALPRAEFVREHKRLLKRGTDKERAEEAKDQADELDEVKAGGPGSGRKPGFGSRKPSNRSKSQLNRRDRERAGGIRPQGWKASSHLKGCRCHSCMSARKIQTGGGQLPGRIPSAGIATIGPPNPATGTAF